MRQRFGDPVRRQSFWTAFAMGVGTSLVASALVILASWSWTFPGAFLNNCSARVLEQVEKGEAALAAGDLAQAIEHTDYAGMLSSESKCVNELRAAIEREKMRRFPRTSQEYRVARHNCYAFANDAASILGRSPRGTAMLQACQPEIAIVQPVRRAANTVRTPSPPALPSSEEAPVAESSDAPDEVLLRMTEEMRKDDGHAQGKAAVPAGTSLPIAPHSGSPPANGTDSSLKPDEVAPGLGEPRMPAGILNRLIP